MSDAAIEASIVSGAATVLDVTKACRAGGGCGSCVDTIERLLSERSRHADTASAAA